MREWENIYRNRAHFLFISERSGSSSSLSVSWLHFNDVNSDFLFSLWRLHAWSIGASLLFGSFFARLMALSVPLFFLFFVFWRNFIATGKTRGIARARRKFEYIFLDSLYECVTCRLFRWRTQSISRESGKRNYVIVVTNYRRTRKNCQEIVALSLHLNLVLFSAFRNPQISHCDDADGNEKVFQILHVRRELKKKSWEKKIPKSSDSVSRFINLQFSVFWRCRHDVFIVFKCHSHLRSSLKPREKYLFREYKNIHSLRSEDWHWRFLTFSHVRLVSTILN